MNKPWVGFLALGLMLTAGILEFFAGETKLGIFLLVMAIISFVLRTVFVRKLKEGAKKD